MQRKDFQKRRHLITQETKDRAVADLIAAYDSELNQKGMAIFASGHEVHGVIKEELDEFFDEVKKNGSKERKAAELLDIAVAALHGVASLHSGHMDWW